MKKLFWRTFVWIDQRLKFPQLKKGETAIQLGFDMDAPVTSDLFQLAKRVGPKGKVYGFDPDPVNVAIANQIIAERNLNIEVFHYAISNQNKTSQLKLGDKRGWNQLEDIPIDSSASYQNSIEVQTRRLDTLLSELNIDVSRVKHINITVNGVEYHTLLGMPDLLRKDDLCLTVIAGRQDETGIINGRPDHELIAEELNKYGFQHRLKRINKSFWWGMVNNALIHRRWVFGQIGYGCILAAKSPRRLKWFQSFS